MNEKLQEMRRRAGVNIPVMPEWARSLETWWLIGFIGMAVFGVCLANTGDGIGQVRPEYKWIWSVGGAFCLALTQGVRTLEKKHGADDKSLDAGV